MSEPNIVTLYANELFHASTEFRKVPLEEVPGLYEAAFHLRSSGKRREGETDEDLESRLRSSLELELLRHVSGEFRA